MNDLECVFCRIASKEIPAKILVETESCVGFLDAFPLAKGHALIIPKNHYEKIQDLPADVNNEIFSTVHKLISRVDSLTGATLVAIHNGKDSGQEIPHVHVHLIPITAIKDVTFINKVKLDKDEFISTAEKIALAYSSL